jgi:hypothetical protein
MSWITVATRPLAKAGSAPNRASSQAQVLERRSQGDPGQRTASILLSTSLAVFGSQCGVLRSEIN